MVNFKGLSVTKSLELFIEPALIFLCDKLSLGCVRYPAHKLLRMLATWLHYKLLLMGIIK